MEFYGDHCSVIHIIFNKTNSPLIVSVYSQSLSGPQFQEATNLICSVDWLRELHMNRAVCIVWPLASFTCHISKFVPFHVCQDCFLSCSEQNPLHTIHCAPFTT